MAKRNYITFVADIKQAILRSRYQAARLVNRELIILYWQVGKMLSEKIEKEGWGAKVIRELADDLQDEIPGLRGFSFRNLSNMRQFYSAYEILPIVQSPTAQLPASESVPLTTAEIGQSATGQIVQSSTAELTKEQFVALLLATSFTHHMLILNKCSDYEEIIFYLKQNYLNHWTVELLKHHLEANLYRKKGKLQSNFSTALPKTIQQPATRFVLVS